MISIGISNDIIIPIINNKNSKKDVSKKAYTSKKYNDGNTDRLIFYPLKKEGVQQTTLKEVEKSKSLLTKTEENKVFINKGYIIEFLGKIDIEKMSRNGLSVSPNLENKFSLDILTNVNLYGSREDEWLEGILTVVIYGNIINDAQFDFEEKKESFAVSYPMVEQIKGVQTGYILQKNAEYSYPVYTISKYYIFKDGTGISIDLLNPFLKMNQQSP